MATAFAAPISLEWQKAGTGQDSLKVGDTAPACLLSDQWKPVKLSNFKGKKNVLLAIYVLAFTGGSTKQLQAVQSGITAGKIDLSDTVVFGVSMDSPQRTRLRQTDRHQVPTSQ